MAMLAKDVPQFAVLVVIDSDDSQGQRIHAAYQLSRHLRSPRQQRSDKCGLLWITALHTPLA